MLSHGSTLQFALDLFYRVTAYLNQNPWIGLFLGFGWLAAVGTWPRWRHRLGVKARLSTEERIASLDAAIKELDGRSSRVEEIGQTSRAALDKANDALRQATGTQSWLERAQLDTKISDLYLRVQSIERRLP
jgi:hypothetical protein